MAVDCTTLPDLLTEAQKAYHQLMTGKAVRKWVDQNGEQMEYSRANIAQLSSYIAQLKADIAECEGGTRAYRGPLRFFFGRPRY